MKVYTLVGKSGTGKSYQALTLCKDLNIESIIDDGLFIYHSQVIAGMSAKRQNTTIGAIKTLSLIHIYLHTLEQRTEEKSRHYIMKVMKRQS